MISEYLRDKLTVTHILKHDLSVAVQQRSSGIFLLVVLVVKILMEKNDAGSTRSELFTALAELPEKLHDLFARILEKIDKAMIAAMQWV